MLSKKGILILGGYGKSGLAMAKLLLRESEHNIGLAGREQVKADWHARALNWEHSCGRVHGVQVNLGLKKQLTGIMEGYDLVIDSIRETGFKGQAARAALDSGTGYIDLNTNLDNLLNLKGLDLEVQAAGLTFITRAGFASGGSALMARHLAGHFDTVHTATTDGLFPGGAPDSPAWVSLDSTTEEGSMTRSDGPAGKGLLNRILGKTGGSLPANLLKGKTRAPVHRPVRAVRTTAAGARKGRTEKLTITLEHRDAYRAEAMAVVPCVLRLLDGSITRTGAREMGTVMDPEQYMEDLWSMGMGISLQGLSESRLEERHTKELRVKQPGLIDQVA